MLNLLLCWAALVAVVVCFVAVVAIDIDRA